MSGPVRPPCMRAGCPGPRKGVWCPVFELRPAGVAHYIGSPIRAMVGLVVCEVCRNVTHLRELLTDENWEHLVNGVRAAGKSTPDRSSVKLVFVHFDSPEAKQNRRTVAARRAS